MLSNAVVDIKVVRAGPLDAHVSVASWSLGHSHCHITKEDGPNSLKDALK